MTCSAVSSARGSSSSVLVSTLMMSFTESRLRARVQHSEQVQQLRHPSIVVWLAEALAE